MNLLEMLDELIEMTQMFDVPMLVKEKSHKLNPKTNRMKISRKTRFLKTNIAPKDRALKNLPRYADDKPMVKFQDWLQIKGEKRQSHHDVASFGRSENNGKWYGWSHRALGSFGVGDKIIAKDYVGRDSFKKEPPFILKTDNEARELAIAFADEVS